MSEYKVRRTISHGVPRSNNNKAQSTKRGPSTLARCHRSVSEPISSATEGRTESEDGGQLGEVDRFSLYWPFRNAAPLPRAGAGRRWCISKMALEWITLGRAGGTILRRQELLMTAKAEPILTFSNASEWDAWLAKHHDRSGAVLLRIPKRKGSDRTRARSTQHSRGAGSTARSARSTRRPGSSASRRALRRALGRRSTAHAPKRSSRPAP